LKWGWVTFSGHGEFLSLCRAGGVCRTARHLFASLNFSTVTRCVA
jgi:hypothetical protein